ncbi:GlxA family transcriptional regulator [Marinobacter sp. ELB17]|uniref:GlxA family transcriptional regulator n=1 Tax=Marinobacter sp. ELB17 TaxID=270374 RepID=UPI0000F38059|nr:GlxA family transcriptional regulator [Marinobacter sp. ELB17]EBA00414.1 putative transcription regulator protein [Marinobacter sp. ELB17]
MIKNYGILLLPEFSNLCFSNLIEPLRAANDLSSQPVAKWHLFSLDGRSVYSTSGLTFPINKSIADIPDTAPLDILFILASYNYESYITLALVRQLRKLKPYAKQIAGLDAGPFALAKAGLLNGYRATIHWAELEVFQETFPEINVCADRYVIDRDRITTGGASTSMDLILEVIRQHHGEQLAIAVAEFLIFDIERPGSNQQREFAPARLSLRAPRLAKAVKVMEANIETPLAISDVAQTVGTSQRQLEREFRDVLKTTPASYYTFLRAAAARRLLQETNFNITQIAMRSGFNSSAALIRNYRTIYNCTPSTDRKLHKLRTMPADQP